MLTIARRWANNKFLATRFCWKSAFGAERKCWHGSLPAAIGGNAENMCSPRVLLTVTDAVEKGLRNGLNDDSC
jgi:hypothetical protein